MPQAPYDVSCPSAVDDSHVFQYKQRERKEFKQADLPALETNSHFAFALLS